MKIRNQGRRIGAHSQLSNEPTWHLAGLSTTDAAGQAATRGGVAKAKLLLAEALPRWAGQDHGCTRRHRFKEAAPHQLHASPHYRVRAVVPPFPRPPSSPFPVPLYALSLRAFPPTIAYGLSLPLSPVPSLPPSLSFFYTLRYVSTALPRGRVCSGASRFHFNLIRQID